MSIFERWGGIFGLSVAKQDNDQPNWECDEAIRDYLTQEPVERFRRSYVGKVTKVIETKHYIFDHQYQFPIDSEELFHFEEGDRVLYNVEDYIVKSVQPAPSENSWENDKQNDADVLKRQSAALAAAAGTEVVVAARVEAVSKESRLKLSGQLSDIWVDLASVEVYPHGFIPQKGDFLSVSAALRPKLKILAIEPQIARCFEGEISRIGKDFVLVDDEIYVPLNCCKNKYLPRVGDWVAGGDEPAIESEQPQGCSWRATCLFARPQSQYRPRRVHAPIAPTPLEDLSHSVPGALPLPEHICIDAEDYLHFGELLSGESKDLIVSIANKSDELTETLLSVRLGNSKVIRCNAALPIVLKPSDRVSLTVTCKPIEVSYDRQPIVFIFASELCKAAPSSSDTFFNYPCAVYYADFTVVEPTVTAPLAPTQPFLPTLSQKSVDTSLRHRDGALIIPPQKLNFANAPTATKFSLPLGRYEIPEKLRNCLEKANDVVAEYPCLKEDHIAINFSTRSSVLLHLEEFAIQADLDKYALSRKFLRPVSCDAMAIEVPGLIDGRPSLLIGDRAILSSPCDGSHGPLYEGLIKEVRLREILVTFAANFHSGYKGEDYNIAFQFNRTPFRRCHWAVETLKRVAPLILFPSIDLLEGPRSICKPPQIAFAENEHVDFKIKKVSQRSAGRPCDYVPRINLQFFNVNLNDRQRLAVVRIVEGVARPIPYLIYGPPGTGKTVTVVEAILQIFHKVSYSRILVATPSNSAADLLCLRLHNSGGVTTSDMVRLNAAQRDTSHVGDEILPYMKTIEFKEEAVRMRIVVTTLITAGQMGSVENDKMRQSSQHFTHCFIDEAGQATEPEACIGLAMVRLSSPTSQLIIAGDPHQLGPILQSKLSRVYGLQVSLLERLSALPIYQRNPKLFAQHGAYNPLVVTKLVDNYRSHTSLFSVSSRLFYDNELVGRAPKAAQNLFVGHRLLANKSIPLVLHGVRGRDEREGSSPSWFNAVEAYHVARYVKELLVDSKEPVVKPADIAIITPYRKQVEKIIQLISLTGLDIDLRDLKIGSVEEFQGQERDVIILSMVRSTETNDVRQALGFLQNPKRMNVAITRAKSLLIVVGNPLVLAEDVHWSEFLRYVVSQGCYTGVDCLTELKQRLAATE